MVWQSSEGFFTWAGGDADLLAQWIRLALEEKIWLGFTMRYQHLSYPSRTRFVYWPCLLPAIDHEVIPVPNLGPGADLAITYVTP